MHYSDFGGVRLFLCMVMSLGMYLEKCTWMWERSILLWALPSHNKKLFTSLDLQRFEQAWKLSHSSKVLPCTIWVVGGGDLLHCVYVVSVCTSVCVWVDREDALYTKLDHVLFFSHLSKTSLTWMSVIFWVTEFFPTIILHTLLAKSPPNVGYIFFISPYKFCICQHNTWPV